MDRCARVSRTNAGTATGIMILPNEAPTGVLITIEVVVQPEFADKLAAAMPVRERDITRHKGFRSAQLLRNELEPNRFLIIQNWDSEADFEAYQAWRSQHVDFPNDQDVLLSYEYDSWSELGAIST
jgi:heme-degrading monooxygenase HmoA